MEENEKIIAAIDLGSTKTVCLIARLLISGELELIGIGIASSRGIKAGSVTNIENIVNSIKEAVEESELMAGTEIENCVINVTGKHIKGDNSTGVIAVTNKDRIISKDDIYRVIEQAQAIRIPADQEILHVLSREFKVDDQTNIKDPTGMIGVRLEADVHIITGGKTQLQNIDRALNEAGIEVKERVLSSLASSNSLLTESEKELGVAVVDIGAGVTDLIIYVDGGVAYSATICIGGQHLTQDISIGMKTPMEAAELIKKRYGTVNLSEIDPTEMIEVPSVAERPPRPVLKKELATIMEARLREIIELVDHEILRSGKKNILAGGIVFTGGSALVDGLLNLSEEIIQLGASIGTPKGLQGIIDKVSSPAFATSVGLIKYGMMYNSEQYSKSKGSSIFKKIKSWLQDNL